MMFIITRQILPYFFSSIISVTTRLAIIREYHQAVVFIPVHLTGSIRRVICYQRWITVDIVCVMVVTNLRGSGGVIAIFVLIHEVVRLCCLCGVHLLNLGKWPQKSSACVTCLLGFTTCIYFTTHFSLLFMSRYYGVRNPIQQGILDQSFFFIPYHTL